MKKITTFTLHILLTSCLFFIFSSRLSAQPEMTLWRIDQAHLNNHHEGTSIAWGCGYEYYITYTGVESSKELILAIKNEGDQVLTLNGAPSFTGASSNQFSIKTPPASLSLQPNEETHFVVQYIAPASYEDVEATLVINSDDPNNGACSIKFDVGTIIAVDPGGPVAAITDLELSSGGAVNPSGTPIDLGATDVGTTITRVFTLTNPNSISGTLIPCTGSDLVSINGADAADFTVTAQPNSSIDSGETINFTIEFTPSSPGAKTATICFDASYSAVAIGGGQNFVLNGMGNALPAAADPIPTMSEWGLMIFGLLVLNLGVLFLHKREEILES